MTPLARVLLWEKATARTGGGAVISNYVFTHYKTR